jgi:peptide/nickel transport system substrate-binding protein
VNTYLARTAGAVAAMAGLLVAAACSAGSTSSPGGSRTGGDNQALAVGLVAEPASLDFTTTDGAAIPQVLLGNVYNGLVRQDDMGKIVPDLAKSWTISPDRKTYTFTLVDNAKFANDAPFTAADAVFSIERVKSK